MKQPETLPIENAAPLGVASSDFLAVLDAAEKKAWREYDGALEKYEAESKLQSAALMEAKNKWSATYEALKAYKKESTANEKAEPPPTRDVNRDSGTDSANGGWLRRMVRQHFVN